MFYEFGEESTEIPGSFVKKSRDFVWMKLIKRMLCKKVECSYKTLQNYVNTKFFYSPKGKLKNITKTLWGSKEIF
jgi:hypothetical protein